MSFISNAFAASSQAASGHSQSQSSEFNIMSFLPMIVIFVLFWFLLIRPQQKKAKLHANMLNELKVGDDVITQSGIYGKIQKIEEQKIALEIAPNTIINIQRATISCKNIENKK